VSDSARAVVAAIAEHWAVPGGAVVAVDRDGEVFSHRFGQADVAAGIPVAPDHRFEIGSISKAFTAIVVLRLVRAGRVRLDDSVGALLDGLPEPLQANGITVERLLNHTAGLVASVDALPDEVGQVTAFAGTVSPTDPGTFFHYSNLGFILLGLIVRRVAGRPLVEVVRDEILVPLGMTSSIACVTHDDYWTLARGYQPLRDDRPWTPGDAIVQAPWLEVAGADGNVAATAADLGRFARVLLHRGAPVLEPAEFDTMIAALAPEGEDVLDLPGVRAPDSSRYGLGINVERVEGRTVLSHGGGMVGYASFLLADLDDGLAVGVVTNANGDTPVAEAIARCVAAELRHPGSVELGGLDPLWWDARTAVGWCGEFVDRSLESLGPGEFRVDGERVGEHMMLTLEAAGERVPLIRTWHGAAVAPMPSLERFGLGFADDAWHWGPRTYERDPKCRASHPVEADDDESLRPYCGHYRAYTPWFTNFRVVLRRGRLLLLSPGGVESTGAESELIPLSDGSFRIGADVRLPERMTFGPVVDGAAAWIDRDGCRYSRAFTD
jgi:D-alanyl-D-alanine carboxypeptidase